MKNRGYKRILSLGIVGLLFVLQLSALAEEKKSPLKIGGALRVGWPTVVTAMLTTHTAEAKRSEMLTLRFSA